MPDLPTPLGTIMMEELPRVVRLCRKGGVSLQNFDCYIGRTVKRGGWNLDASIWANPFKRRTGFPPGSTLPAYEQYVRSNPLLMHNIPLLAGKTLGCWCKPEACHGDILVKLVKEYFEEEDFEELPADIDDNITSEDYEQNNYFQYSKSITLEGVTIGITHMKRPYVCVMAISDGQLIRPLPSFRIKQSDQLATVGTKFWFTVEKKILHEHTKLPHCLEDFPISITGIDSTLVDPKLLHQMISSCAISEMQSEGSRKLLEVLAANQKQVTKTPYVLEGDDVHSSIITEVESDVIIYHTDMERKPKAQFQVLGNEFHLPVTSLDVIEMLRKAGGNKLILKQKNVDFVRVSLARPFLPWMSPHLDKPRCYAMLTGVVYSINNVVTIV